MHIKTKETAGTTPTATPTDHPINGFSSTAASAVNPGATANEVDYDGIDQDCDKFDFDADEDNLTPPTIPSGMEAPAAIATMPTPMSALNDRELLHRLRRQLQQPQ